MYAADHAQLAVHTVANPCQASQQFRFDQIPAWTGCACWIQTEMSLEQNNAAEVLRVNANDHLLERLEHRIRGLKGVQSLQVSAWLKHTSMASSWAALLHSV